MDAKVTRRQFLKTSALTVTALTIPIHSTPKKPTTKPLKSESKNQILGNISFAIQTEKLKRWLDEHYTQIELMAGGKEYAIAVLDSSSQKYGVPNIMYSSNGGKVGRLAQKLSSKGIPVIYTQLI